MSTAQAPEPTTVYEPGSAVDHYKILRLIGRGGMGEVYLARDTRLGRKVALKVVRPDAMDSPDARERFLFEARTTARFNHPHIVTIHDVGEHDSRPYVALEHLEGESLRERLQREQPGPGETLRIGRAIAEALVEAHAADIVHRDLKPGNVLLGADGRLRVVDFGLARAVSAPAPTAQDLALLSAQEAEDLSSTFETNGAGLRGTPAYMAPEQWQQQSAGPPADLWALGVILCQMAYGVHPFAAATPLALCARVLDPEPVSLPDGGEGVDQPLAQLIGECMSKTATDRPTAAEVAKRLANMMQGERRRPRHAESPFRGLLPFDERHGDLFFGRDDEIAAFVERLRAEPVLPVVGPSGAGKSSFVQAGVMPRLREQGRWILLRLRPGARPLRALAQRFVRGDTSALQTGSQLRSSPTPRAPTPSDPGLEATVAADSMETSGLEETTLADPGDTPAPPPGTSAPLPAAGSEDLEAALREAPHRLALLLAGLAEQEQARVLLFVDQLEELYTLVEDEGERATFMEAVAGASDDPESPVRVVFTLRDDFLGRLAATDAARQALSRVTVLRSPGPEALREILVQPLRAVGHSYEDDALVDEMVQEVRGEVAALPLLQFAGAALWERRDREKRLLTRAAYREQGGVAGALAHHADGVLDGLSPAQVTLARQVLLRLVTSAGTRQVVARRELLAGLAGDAPEVLDRLIAGRTVLQRKARMTDTTETVCELVHESLIERWDRLRRWVEASREERAFLAEASQAAALWEKRGRRDTEVWTGDALAEARRSLSRLSGGVPPRVRAFIAAGEARQRRGRQRLRLAVALVVAGLAAVALVLAFQKGEVTRQRNQARTEQQRAQRARSTAEKNLRRARRNLAEALREGALAALARKDYPEARARLRASLEIQDSPLARTLWLQLRSRDVHWAHDGLDGYCEALFTPDGRHVVTCAENNKAIYFLDVDTRRITRTYRLPRGALSHIALAPDGLGVAAGSQQGTVWLWTRDRKAPIALRGHSAKVLSVDFSRDGRWLVTASRDRTVRLWDARGGKLKRVLRGHQAAVRAVRFHPHSRILASAGSLGDQTVRLWEVPSGKLLGKMQRSKTAVVSLAWAPDGRRLASGGFDRVIRLWDPNTKRLQRELHGHKAAVISLQFSPDGHHLASGGNGDGGRIWSLNTAKTMRTITGSEGALIGLSYHPTRPLLATKAATHLRLTDLTVPPRRRPLPLAAPTQFYPTDITPDLSRLVLYSDRELRIRHLATGRETHIQTGHTGLIISVALGRKGRLLASGGLDNTVRLWDLNTGKLRRVLVGGQPYGAGFNRQSDQLLTYSVARPVAELWSHRAPAKPVLLGGHDSPVRAFAFRRDGGLVATGGRSGSIRIWRARTGRFLRAFKGHESTVYELAFSARGDVLYSAGKDHHLRFWQVASGRLLRDLSQHRHAIRQLRVSEDGRYLLSRSNREVWLWDASAGTGQELGRLTDHHFTDAAVHPRGQMAAATLSTGDVWIWHLPSLRRTTRYGHGTSAVRVAFRRDGEQLAVLDQDTVRKWDVSTLRPVWRAPLLSATRGELLTHNGWTRLNRDRAAHRAAGAKWRRALERSSAQADESADGRWLCARTYGDQLQLWDLRADRLVFSRDVPSLVAVHAVADSCLVRVRGGPAQLHTRRGTPRTLAKKATAVNVGPGDRELLVATPTRVRLYGADGTPRGSIESQGRVTALMAHGDLLVLGHAGGALSLKARSGGAVPAVTRFRTTPASAVTSLLSGSRSTVVAGFANGAVGVWNSDTGRRLYHLRLLGPVVHLAQASGRLHMATAQGDHRAVDAPAFGLSYCDLLRQVWRHVRVDWRGGRPQRRDPPPDHWCARQPQGGSPPPRPASRP